MLTRILPTWTIARRSAWLAIAGLASACHAPTDAPSESLSEQAVQLARGSIVVDTHIDVPIRVVMTGDDVTRATTGGAFDYPRAHSGGLDVAFMSIFIPASVDEAGGGRAFA